MIVVIDYGAGNLRSVANAFEAIGATPQVTTEPDDLEEASGIVLPGVGAFGDGMAALREAGFVGPLEEQVLGKKTPFLGICLGMQFLADSSAEHGRTKGLGWIGGTVERLTPDDPQFRVPHMGWNDVQLPRPSPLFDGLDSDPAFYFVHSYHLRVAGSASDSVTSTCWHGGAVTASVQKDHIFGVQFHPEKSQRDGLKVLANFLDQL